MQTSLYKDAVRASSVLRFLASMATNWKMLILVFHKLKFQARQNYFSYSLQKKQKRMFYLKTSSTTYMLFYVNCVSFPYFLLVSSWIMESGMVSRSFYTTINGRNHSQVTILVASIYRSAHYCFINTAVRSPALRIHSDSCIAWFPTRKRCFVGVLSSVSAHVKGAHRVTKHRGFLCQESAVKCSPEVNQRWFLLYWAIVTFT